MLDPIDPSFLTDSVFKRPFTAGSERYGSPLLSDEPGAPSRPGRRVREYKSNLLKAAEARGGPSKFRRDLQENRIKAQAVNSLHLMSSMDFFAPESEHLVSRDESNPVRQMDEMAKAAMQAESEAKRELALKLKRMEAAAEKAERGRVKKEKERERERERVATEKDRENELKMQQQQQQAPLAPQWSEEEEARRLEKVKAMKAEEERKKTARAASIKAVGKTPSIVTSRPSSSKGAGKAAATPARAATPTSSAPIETPTPSSSAQKDLDNISTSAPASAPPPFAPVPASVRPSSSTAAADESEYGGEAFDASAEESIHDIAFGGGGGTSVAADELESSVASIASVGESIEAAEVPVLLAKNKGVIVEANEVAEEETPVVEVAAKKPAAPSVAEKISIASKVTLQLAGEVSVGAQMSALRSMTPTPPCTPMRRDGDVALPSFEAPIHTALEAAPTTFTSTSIPALSCVPTLTPPQDGYNPTRVAVAAKAAEVSASVQREGVRNEYIRGSTPPKGVAFSSQSAPTTPAKPDWSTKPVCRSFDVDLLQDMAFAEGEQDVDAALMAVQSQDIPAALPALPAVDPNDMFMIQGRGLAPAPGPQFGSSHKPQGLQVAVAAAVKAGKWDDKTQPLDPEGESEAFESSMRLDTESRNLEASIELAAKAVLPSSAGRGTRGKSSGSKARGLDDDEPAEDVDSIRERLGYEHDEFEEDSEVKKKNKKKGFDINIQPFYDDEFDIEGAVI